MKMFRRIAPWLAVIAATVMMSCVPKEAPVAAPPKPARVAVVLGAGAAKGFAHVGVLKVLESHKVPISMVVGTSVGSFVGSLYASGIDAYRLQILSFSLDRDEVVDFTLPDNGFVAGDKLEVFVNRQVRGLTLEKLKIPFFAVATDIASGTETVFATGNTGKAVRASCSIPGVFKPVRILDKTYVDGGLVSPVAVEAARRMGADVVIAVDISAGIGSAVPKGTIETILRSVDIMYAKIADAQLKQADVAIRPRVGHIGSGDFSRRLDAVLEGEKAAMESLPAIQRILDRLKSEGRLPAGP